MTLSYRGIAYHVPDSTGEAGVPQYSPVSSPTTSLVGKTAKTLRYRGIAYQLAQPSVDMPKTQHVGHFLGQSFPLRNVTLAEGNGSSVTLCYRGLQYSR